MRINEIVTEGKTGPGLWANIHAKRERIKSGSGEKMRKPGSKGAPTAKNFKDAANEGVAEGSLNEFAPPGSNDGDDGFSEEALKRMAAQWYNGDEDPKVERTLMAAGWEIGQDEGYDDEPGVFVVQRGDDNGNSYISWPAHELKQGVAEGSLEEYGDTAKGQKMLTKVQKRAVDRVVSKKADTDPKYARKNADTADRAWERMTDKDVAEGSLNEFAPGGNDGDDRDYEYEVYQCNPKDQFDWVGGPIYKTDDMAKAHGVAYNLNKKHPNKAFMIWQERSQGSRGGYGIKDDEQGVAEDSNEVDYPVELSAEIINWIKKTYPTATVAQLRDKSWIADKVKEYHREPKVLSGVRQAAQDAGRLEESMLEETYDGDEFYEAYGDLWYDEEQLNEAEYQGRKVQLGKPVRSSNGPKKFHVFVKDPSTGNVKKVNFGDKNMRIKKSDPARRKSFRARHNCANPGPRTKAKYWSCRNW
jgi:hypothetical protein